MEVESDGRSVEVSKGTGKCWLACTSDVLSQQADVLVILD